MIVGVLLVVAVGWPAPARAAPGAEAGPVTGAAPLTESAGPSGSPVAGDAVIVRPYDPPGEPWEAGHRGVDVAAVPGSPVLATRDGSVSFSGIIAGRGVLVIDHGDIRTTYEPVGDRLPRGTRVRAGQAVGRVDPGHACGHPGATCLHVGLKRGEVYLEPVFGSAAAVRLLPLGAGEGIRTRAGERAAAAAAIPPSVDAGPAPPPGAQGLVRPAAGRVTSRFGMRRHPVLGVTKLHDGVDFGLPCGAPLRAVAPGRVSEAYFNAGYGNRLLIDHGQVGGRHLVSAYNHAAGYGVSPGQQVAAGEVIGTNGTTGYSTGCHLHFMLWVDGRLVDPEPWV